MNGEQLSFTPAATRALRAKPLLQAAFAAPGRVRSRVPCGRHRKVEPRVRKSVQVYFEDGGDIRTVETEWEILPGPEAASGFMPSGGPRLKIPTIPGYLIIRAGRHPSACEFVALSMAPQSND